MADKDASGQYSVGIVTVSDTAFADASSDRSGPTIKALLQQHRSKAFRIADSVIVPDEPDQIAETVRRLIDGDGDDLVILTGGTGLGVRDGTPEALSGLIHKQIPSLVQALVNHSLQKTPFAALSRFVAGVRQRESRHGSPGSLIIALPGSPKAVTECMELLLSQDSSDPLLIHALDLCTARREAKAKEVHKDMQAQAAGPSGWTIKGTETDTGSSRTQIHAHHHHHHHHHHGHDDSHSHEKGAQGLHSHTTPTPRTSFLTHSAHGPSTARARQSPYPVLPMDRALSLIHEHTPTERDVLELPVDERLVGHVLAQDVIAQRDLPPGNTTNVDGYAVSAATTPIGVYKVVTASILATRKVEEAQGTASEPLLQPGEICRVNTGQALPLGTDGVVMVEDTELVSTSVNATSGLEDEAEIKILAQIDAGENVRNRGSDVKESQIVLRAGTPITPLGGEIGTLAFLGYQRVKVYRKPRVAILSTGAELVDVQKSQSTQEEAWGFRVYDANRPGLRAALEALHLEVVDLGILGDDASALVTTLRTALDSVDVILTTGGTSMGESDLLKPIIERDLNGTIHFGRVAMKPGKPTTFATVAHGSGEEMEKLRKRVIFALPGNPASSLVTFYVFVLPCLRQLIGHPPRTVTDQSPPPAPAPAPFPNPYSLPTVPCRLLSPCALDPRPEFHRVTLTVCASTGELQATSTGKQRSSGMHSLAGANGLVAVPSINDAEMKSKGKKRLEVGEIGQVIILGTLG